MDNLNLILGYAGRTALGTSLAVVFATVGVILARMTVVLFSLLSWQAWFTLWIAGVSIGAGAGALIAWLWLRHAGRVFTGTLLLLAILAGVVGALSAHAIGANIELEWWAGHAMDARGYTIIGAAIGANLMALGFGGGGHLILRNRRITRIMPGRAKPANEPAGV
jgi:hypothetical protein